MFGLSWLSIILLVVFVVGGGRLLAWGWQNWSNGQRPGDNLPAELSGQRGTDLAEWREHLTTVTRMQQSYVDQYARCEALTERLERICAVLERQGNGKVEP